MENPDGFRFCGFCAALLTADGAPEEVRKAVTVVFCDVTGSTAMGERLDPEAVRRVMSRYFDEMKTVLEHHGGTVEKFIGDAVMAVFGVPGVHEDDALRAVRAAADMRERLRDLNKELERDFGVTIASRIGVNTGEVVSGTGEQTLVTGDAVNVAARLEQAAQPGEILIGEDTRRLVRDAIVAEPVEALELKGKAERMHAFRMLSVAGAEGIARRFDAQMVGRQGELQVLRDVLQRAERDRACWLVTVLGPAGVGKSRLVREFLEREAARASMIRGRCLPYGDGITYWPVVEMLTASAQIADLDGPDEVRAKIGGLLGDVPDASTVVERLAQFLGLEGAAAAPEETHWAVRKLFEAMADRSTLMAVFDDIHSAEPALLDLIEHIADWSRDAPILVLCTARPELLDGRPGWGGGKLNSTSFLLEALTEAECDELIGNLLERAELPEDARRTITDAAGGNPLFVEQMVGMLIDDGRLCSDGERWTFTGDLAQVAVPPSIMALLEARLDRLSPDERATMERASVEGKVFHLGSVSALTPDADRPHVRERLMALVRRDLIRPDRSLFAGDAAFRFRHLLIRDAAYWRLPKQTRAGLHEKHADWLERSAGDRAAEFEEIMGYHLEQASRLRAELGPLDDQAKGLGERAAELLMAAGRRAQDRGDVPATLNLLSRAAELLPPNSTARPMLLADLALALEGSGRYDDERAALDEAVDLAEATGDFGSAAIAKVGLLQLQGHLAEMTDEGILAELHALLPSLENLADDRALAGAWGALGASHFYLGHTEEAEAALERATRHARTAGDGRTEGLALGTLGSVLTHGPTPVEDALSRLPLLAERSGGSKVAEGLLSIHVGALSAMLGRIDDARSAWGKARDIHEELGERMWAAADTMYLAGIELMAGDPALAEAPMRDACETLERAGEKGWLSTVAANLAEVLWRQGKLDEVERFTAMSREAAAADDWISQMQWRATQAKLLADRGELGEAERLAREAVEVMDRTDYLSNRGDARMSLAYVLRKADRQEEMAAAAREALRFYERKGDIADSATARALLAEIGV
jgi:class 3 adenylate cyclase/tetratricopeptide (TPR) repeat protein